MDDLKARIKKHEGFRDVMYKDSLGFATIGYGHLILSTDDYVDGRQYSKEDLDKVFDKDFQNALDNANKLMSGYDLVNQAKEVICEWFSN